MLVFISTKLVFSIYGEQNCSDTVIGFQCREDFGPNISEAVKIIVAVVKFMTGFVSVITVLLIIYA